MLLAEQQGRICDACQSTLILPVHTAWDIGVDDAMAILVLPGLHPDHLDIVDYYEGHGVRGFGPLLRMARPAGLHHGTDWYPHDVKVREAGSPGARTRIETLITMGRKKPELVPDEDLMEGVNAGRKATIPFARFDTKRCAQGLESLRSYRNRSGMRRREAFKKTPEHNWASHGADCAWRRTCLCPGARADARSGRRRRCLSASPSRT